MDRRIFHSPPAPAPIWLPYCSSPWHICRAEATVVLDGSLEVRQLQGLLIPGAQPDAGGVKLKLGGAPGWACLLVLCGQVGCTVSLELLCWLSDSSFCCLYKNKAMWLYSLSNAVVEGECFYVLATRGHCRGAADQPMGRGKLPAVCVSGKAFSTPRLLIWLPGPIISTVPGTWRGVDGKETGK